MKCNCKNNFCELRSRILKPRDFQYCQGTSGLPEWKEQWYLAKLDNDLEKMALLRKENPTTLAEKVGNFGMAALAYATDGFKNVTEEEYQRRLEICKGCPLVQIAGETMKCGACGCTLNGDILAKARWRTQECPQKKW